MNPDPDDTVDDFDPDWCVHPGATIQDWLDENRVSARALAAMLWPAPDALADKRQERVRRLLSGDQPIDEDLARRLSAVTGGSVSFWLNRERQFRRGLAQGKTWMR